MTICYHTIYAPPWIFPPLVFYGLDILLRFLRYRIKDATLTPIGNQMTMVECLSSLSLMCLHAVYCRSTFPSAPMDGQPANMSDFASFLKGASSNRTLSQLSQHRPLFPASPTFTHPVLRLVCVRSESGHRPYTSSLSIRVTSKQHTLHRMEKRRMITRAWSLVRLQHRLPSKS